MTDEYEARVSALFFTFFEQETVTKMIAFTGSPCTCLSQLVTAARGFFWTLFVSRHGLLHRLVSFAATRTILTQKKSPRKTESESNSPCPRINCTVNDNPIVAIARFYTSGSVEILSKKLGYDFQDRIFFSRRILLGKGLKLS